MRGLHLFSENLRISMRYIRANMLRAILTMLIIGFGIMALVGILTAIDAIESVSGKMPEVPKKGE